MITTMKYNLLDQSRTKYLVIDEGKFGGLEPKAHKEKTQAKKLKGPKLDSTILEVHFVTEWYASEVIIIDHSTSVCDRAIKAKRSEGWLFQKCPYNISTMSTIEVFRWHRSIVISLVFSDRLYKALRAMQ
jgi:hypothetical protein